MASRSVLAARASAARTKRRAPAEEDYVPGFRDTVGWSREVERPEAWQTHWPVIEAGARCMERLAPGLGATLARTLSPDPAKVARLVELDREILQLARRPARSAEQGEGKNARLMDRVTERHEVWLDLEDEVARARRVVAPQLARLLMRLMMREDARAASKIAERIRLHECARGVADPVRLRTWVRACCRLLGPLTPDPTRVAMTHTRARASYDPLRGVVDVGDHPEASTIFHELGHAVEFAQPTVASALITWREARARKAGFEGKLLRLRDVHPGVGYGPSERAVPDHFVSDYVGKVYDTGATEVLAMGLEHFASGARMAQLYERDPEHFLLVLGLLDGGLR
ncbi:MAG: hypothetical protein KC933_10975 [Myxococcales bacterium]|nr:hypothetical protein [Myxococcales bacterium]